MVSCVLGISAFGSYMVYAGSRGADGMIINRGERFDEDPDEEITVSENLEHDLRVMWQLVEIDTKDQSGDVVYNVSPVSAINAASRAFESLKSDLIGLNREQVLSLLKNDPKHHLGSYNFPFWSLPKGQNAMVFRFDCGNFGWQFDLHLDENETVSHVERRWIH